MKKRTAQARTAPGFTELNTADPRAAETGPKEPTKNTSFSIPERLHTALMIERGVSKRAASAILVEALEARYGVATNRVDPQALAAVRALLNPDPAVAEMHARYDDPEAEADMAKRYAEDPLIP